MIKEHKVIGILINTLVMCGLTLALLQTNADRTNENFLTIGLISGIAGNIILTMAYINNTLED